MIHETLGCNIYSKSFDEFVDILPIPDLKKWQKCFYHSTEETHPTLYQPKYDSQEKIKSNEKAKRPSRIGHLFLRYKGG